jgi:hypothetical protein
MARGKDVPEAIRNQIIGMWKAGCTFVAIGAEYNMNENTANSPDFNPIENLLPILLQAHTTQLYSQEETLTSKREGAN